MCIDRNIYQTSSFFAVDFKHNESFFAPQTMTDYAIYVCSSTGLQVVFMTLLSFVDIDELTLAHYRENLYKH